MLSAGVWSLTSYAGSQIIRLGSNMIMTRLLLREDFGLFTLVTTYQVGITMFSDVGLNAYLFQSQKAHDRKFADGIWTLCFLRGLIVWMVALALAWPMAKLYNHPNLFPILAINSIGLLINTLQATKLTLASRDLKQKELAVFGIANQTIGIVILIALAWWFRSVWALVIGGLAGDLIRVAASQWCFPGERNRWRWDPAIAQELQHFSKWVYIGSVMTFIGGQADRLILGKIMPLEFLGLYGLAMNFATLPLSLVQQGSGLLSPIVVQLRHSNDSTMQEKLQQARFLLLKAGAILVAVMCVSAPAFYGLLYDPRWHEAGILAALLGLNIWASVLGASMNGILIAFGDAKAAANVSMMRVLGALVGIGLGYWLGGLYGFVLGTAGAGLATYVVECIALRRWKLTLGWSDMPFSFECAIYIAMGWTVLILLHWSPIELSMRCASVLATIMLCAWIAYRERNMFPRLMGPIRTHLSGVGSVCKNWVAAML